MREEYEFELTGGRLCLDFVNTVSGDRAGRTRERLSSYADLVSWARQTGAIDEPYAQRLLHEAKGRPSEAARTLREAIAFREALYRTFAAIAERRDADANDVSHVSSALGPALAHRRLDRTGATFTLGWEDPPRALEAPLWRVAESAASLLSSGHELERVRLCGMHETHECSWVFMDATRAGTRRWCSMKDCGNRAKARRHYKRSKDAGAG